VRLYWGFAVLGLDTIFLGWKEGRRRQELQQITSASLRNDKQKGKQQQERGTTRAGYNEDKNNRNKSNSKSYMRGFFASLRMTDATTLPCE
jgi:hypothetical protein